MRDDLQTWLSVRAQVAWNQATEDLAGPIRGRRDAIDAAVARDESGDPTRGERMRTAWRSVQEDAAAGRALSFDLMAGWQRTVLGRGDVAFRDLPAFAKGGRERYGLHAGTPGDFDRCLAQATATDVPLPARAARAYLDVCFFHPFDDGNGRAALLAMAFVLAREQVFLDEVGPVQVRRYADDPVGARALARLVHLLATAAQRRGPVRPHASTPCAETPDHPSRHPDSFTSALTRR